MTDRDSYYEALLARLKDAVPEVLTWTRRDLTSDQLLRTQKPAGILRVSDMTPINERGLPTRWILGAAVILYVQQSPHTMSPDEELNGLIDRIADALQAQEDERQDLSATTLGGICERCWISDTIEYVQGEGSGQAAAVIPIDILVVG